MSELPVIDPAAIEMLRELSPGDDSFLKELIEVFLADAPLRLAELDRYFASNDSEGFIRAAHSLKGSSANMGAAALREVSGKLEHQARHAGVPASFDGIAPVKAEFARAAVEYRKMLG